MSNAIERARGRIIIPGAKGINYDGVEAAFPIDLPVEVLRIEGETVTVIEPRGQIFIFQTTDVQIVGVDKNWWDEEWNRHQNPEKHRWDLVDIIHKYGRDVYSDWEAGPYPVKEYKDLFAGVFLACKTYELTKDPEFHNALIDLSLLMFGEIDDVDISQDYIDAVVFTVYQLLTCQKFTKSGTDWSNTNLDEWLTSLESPVD
jgi:hypothetical protein